MLTLERRVNRIRSFLKRIAHENRKQCEKLFEDNLELFKISKGSNYSHQAYSGGYIEHIHDCLQLADDLTDLFWRKYPESDFSQANAFLVLFLHDIEKPWIQQMRETVDKDFRLDFKLRKIAEYKIILNPEQSNALRYCEGEGKDYSPNRRVMNEPCLSG